MLTLIPDTGLGIPTESILTAETLSTLWKKCAAESKDPAFDPESWKGSQPWYFFDAMMSMETSMFQSMSKARKLGWTGYLDSEECLYAIFDRMERDGVFPAKMLPGREGGRKAFTY